jgi:hypothetical protein
VAYTIGLGIVRIHEGHAEIANPLYREVILRALSYDQQVQIEPSGVVNGGGRIDREYGLGRGALDLIITWRGTRHVVELKLRRDTQTEERALDQVVCYLEHAGLDEGTLVLFDLRSTRPWAERLTRETLERGGKRIHVVGC